MPIMPFHLEKGHAFGALQDLLNDPANEADLVTLHAGLNDPGKPLGALFRDLLTANPTLDAYGGHPLLAGSAGLGDFVASAWFGEPKADGTPGTPYWLDYSGNVSGIVRQAFLYAMEVAWGAAPGGDLPDAAQRTRPIEVWWHCAQRWFDAWVTWEDDAGPVRLLFATPPHAGGDIAPSVPAIEGPGYVERIPPASGASDGDMVLITETDHTQKATIGSIASKVGWSTSGEITLPTVGDAYEGSGVVGTWRIFTNAGGIQPKESWS